MFFLRLLVAAIACSLPIAHAASKYWVKPAKPAFPVIQIGQLCAEACSGMNVSVRPPCYDCLRDAGWLNPWTADNQPAHTMARMPFREAGLEGVAFPLQVPDEEYAMKLNKGIYDREMMFMSLLTKNIEICHGPRDNQVCTTRNAAPGKPTPSNSSPTGFCWGERGWLRSVTPYCDGDDPLQYVKVNKPEDLGRLLILESYSNHEQEMVDYAKALFTDVQTAADSIWYANSNAWSPTLNFFHVDSSDLAELQQRFGADWSAEMTSKLQAGKLVRMNLDTWLTEADKYFPMNDDLFLPGPDGVFEKVFDEKQGTFIFRCIIIRVADAGRHRVKPEVYTPAKSPTAFITAMLMARASVLFTNIMSHSTYWHMVSEAQQYVIYNTLDAGVPVYQSMHPMRQLLDEFMDPRLQVPLYFGISRNGVGYSVDATKAGIHGQRSLFFKTGGPLGNSRGRADMYGLTPPGLLERTGLDVKEFTAEGGKEWGLWDHANLHMEVWRACKAYADDVIPIYWKRTSHILEDQQLVNLLKGLADPEVANLGRLVSSGNEVDTPRKLSEFVANMIYTTVIHAFNHFHDFMVKTANPANAGSTNLVIPGGPRLPDPTGQYSVDYMMENYVQNISTIGDFAGVAFFVWGIPSMGGPWLFPVEGSDQEVDWTRALPFKVNPDLTGQDAVQNKKQVERSNEAAVKFRKALVDLSMNYPVGPVRPINNNYNMPWFWTVVQDV